MLETTSGVAVPIDSRQLQVNQGAIVALVLIGFVIGGGIGATLVALTGLSLAAGALAPGSGPFQLLYRRLLRPLGLAPDVHRGDPSPHRFAAMVGSTLLIAAALLIAAGAAITGWAIAFVVVALALVNLAFGFCAGCFLYLQIARVRKGGAA
jgi:hypothetical protein